LNDLLATARAEAARLQHDYIGTEHLFLGLLRGEDRTLATVLSAFGANPETLRERLERRLPKGRGSPAKTVDELSIRSGARRALEAAQAAAEREGTPSGPRHLLTALLLDGKGPVAASLGDIGIPVEKVRQTLGTVGPGAAAPAPAAPAARRDPPPESPAPSARRGREGRNAHRERGEERAPPRRTPPDRGQSPGGRIAPVQQSWFAWRRLPLLAIPVSVGLGLAHGISPALTFAAACIAVVPLAGFLGEATEHLAARTTPALGALLNATFGNAAELIIGIMALRAGLIGLVQASITGSILGNLLLVLGLALVAGGLRQPFVRFNRTFAGTSAAMLALAVTGVIFPGVIHWVHAGDVRPVVEQHLSEAVATVLAVTYGFSLLFSLRTQKRLLCSEAAPEGIPWKSGTALAVLGLASAGVAVESEILVGAVRSLSLTGGFWSETFLGLILIPVIGNAAEHASAVTLARKGKMDLALQIAMGSSAQVALLVAPVLVFVSAALGPSPTGGYLSLVFPPIQVVAVGLATLLAALLTLDGESHWLEGVQLLALYAMVAVTVYFI
jgi:Ca2+:H+ antiporter